MSLVKIIVNAKFIYTTVLFALDTIPVKDNITVLIRTQIIIEFSNIFICVNNLILNLKLVINP